MTRQHIIDNYGFDPHNYTKIFVFNYYEENNDAYIFHDKYGNNKTYKKCDFFNGLFVRSRWCDLSYIFGAKGFPTIPLNTDVNCGAVILHRHAFKYVVISRDRFEMLGIGYD